MYEKLKEIMKSVSPDSFVEMHTNSSSDSQAENCDMKCRNRPGSACLGDGKRFGGYVVGTAPFCGGVAADCNPTAMHDLGYHGSVGFKDVSVGGGYTEKKRFEVSFSSFCAGASKEYSDGGADCLSGTKVCCCMVKKERYI